MKTTRRWFFVGFVAVVGLGIALRSARPHVVERWALYLGSPQQTRSAHLFLDPFPNAYSCRTRVEAFAVNGEAAFCTSHAEVEFGGATDALLAADFDPFSLAAWLCLPHLQRVAGHVARAQPEVRL